VEVHVPITHAAVPDADRGEIITTRRLTLRRFCPGDAAAFHAVLSDAETMRYWSTPPHRHMAETEAWVERTISAVAAGEADDFIALREGSVVGKARALAGQ
jgi:[ribosomal protein S5]-alanine N-acetyltransferase